MLSLRNSPKFDVVVVPGGLGQQGLMEDAEILNFFEDAG